MSANELLKELAEAAARASPEQAALLISAGNALERLTPTMAWVAPCAHSEREWCEKCR